MKSGKSKPAIPLKKPVELDFDSGEPLQSHDGLLKILTGAFIAWVGFLIVLYFKTLSR